MSEPRELKVGDRIKDNDPRMGNRVLTIVEVARDGKSVLAGRDGFAWARLSVGRIHTDGKPRRSGFSLIREAA